jgi:CRISPR-associated protein Csb1
MWDSTGPKGGQGAKFQRALVSEIVGVGVEFGRKTASRIDPASIELNAGPVLAAKDTAEDWTHLETEAKRDEKGNPMLFSRKGKDKPGRPSNINHGNIAPSVDSVAGGVTLDYAQQTTVLSLPALRRLRFPKDTSGATISRDKRDEVEHYAHVAIAALALAGVALQREDGFDLRSRCAFVPEGPFVLEVIDRDGSGAGCYSLSPDDAESLVSEASEAARAVGMGWREGPVDLRPAPKLVALIRKSREVAAIGEDVEA